LPPYSGDEDDRSDGSIWDNDVHEFYDEDNHHQTQETYSEAEELYVGSYEDGIGLSDDVKHLDEQMEQNDLPSDKLSDLREDIFNEDSLNDINDFVENLDESSFYDQTFDNDKIIKSEIDTETSETNEQNTSKVSKEFEEDVDVETSEINEQNTSKVSKEFEEDVDAETSETNEQNTPKVLKELEEDVDDNIPSTTEFDDGKEYDFSSVYDSKENDLFAPIDDEWAAEYTASELDPTINDNEIIVSPGKRERPYTNDNE
ncbi:11100_t:CDS:2, partial [Scutellospora calospora]